MSYENALLGAVFCTGLVFGTSLGAILLGHWLGLVGLVITGALLLVIERAHPGWWDE